MNHTTVSPWLTVPAAVAGLTVAAVPAWVGASRLAAWAATAPVRRRIGAHPRARTVAFTARDGVRLAAWCFDPPAGLPARGTVVLGHGYRDDRRQLAPLAEHLAARGFRALAMDFRAHGESHGDRITLGVLEALDVRAALAMAGALGGPVGYVGFSMGAAAYLLAGCEASAAVLDSPYDTLTEAVGTRLDRFRVPRGAGRELVRAGGRRTTVAPESVRPIDAVAGLTRPTWFVFGARDPWLSGSTRAWFRTALPPCGTWTELPGAGHANHFDADWYTRVATFLDRTLGATD